MADLRISQLPPLNGAALQADDVVAIVDLSASETKKITVKDLVQSTVALIDAGSIPGDKVTVTLPDGSVGTLQLADGSVTGIKLADNSTAIFADPLPATGEYIGQLGITGGKPYIWNGSIWLPFTTGITNIQGGTIGPVTTGVTIVGNSASVLAKVDDSVVPAAFLAGPTASAGPVELRPIVSGDLPVAGVDVAGVVSVPQSGGLAIDGGDSGFGSDIVINNDVTPTDAVHVVAYTAKGLIKNGRPIQSGDLPLATPGSAGALYPGPEFNISASGEFTIANSVAPGEFAVVTYDGHGLITSGRNMVSDDLPDINADKITQGTLPTERLADKSVTRPKLANYSTAYIQEVAPSIGVDDFIGVGWYQESTGQLRLWNGNSWMPVGFGRLSNDNLRWGGIVDAATGLMVGVTDSGTNAGLAIGDPLPAATNNLGGLYVVSNSDGDQIGVTPGITYDAGDWCLCINEAEGWVRINTMVGGGGGGGGASTLNELLDVTVTGATDGQYLQLQANNQWQNVDLDLPTKTSDLTNDGDDGSNPFISAAEVNNILDGKNPDGTPNPGAPVYLKPGDNVSELDNDAGYITSADVGDGLITIKKADGTEVGKFTVNQDTPTDILLPADVVPSPPGDGKLTIADADGTKIGDFTANQASDEQINLPRYLTSVSLEDLTDTEIDRPIANDVLVFTGVYDTDGCTKAQEGEGFSIWVKNDSFPNGKSVSAQFCNEIVSVGQLGFANGSYGNVLVIRRPDGTQENYFTEVALTPQQVEGAKYYLSGVSANGQALACQSGDSTGRWINQSAADVEGLSYVPLGSWANIPARTSGGGGTDPDFTITLSSLSFNEGGSLSTGYFFDGSGCPGNNVNPQIQWTVNDLAAGVTITSFSVLCVDTNANNFVHWNLSNIPPDTDNISETGAVPAGTVIQPTGFGAGARTDNGWAGPCPPVGFTHTYTIVVTALYTKDEGGAFSQVSNTATFIAIGQ